MRTSELQALDFAFAGELAEVERGERDESEDRFRLVVVVHSEFVGERVSAEASKHVVELLRKDLLDDVLLFAEVGDGSSDVIDGARMLSPESFLRLLSLSASGRVSDTDRDVGEVFDDAAGFDAREVEALDTVKQRGGGLFWNNGEGDDAADLVIEGREGSV